MRHENLFNRQKMTSDKLTETILTQKIKENRKSIEKDFVNNFDVQQKTLSIIIGGLQHANYNNFETASIVWNISGYLNLVSYDLKIIVRDLMFEEQNWQRKLYARQAYLLIYESMNGFLTLLGKPLLNAINEFSDAKVYTEKVRSITNRLNTFKKEHEEAIKTVRHTSIAHRDKDMLVQFKSIESISWLEATAISTKFDTIVTDLGAVCQQLINRVNDDLEIKEGTRH